MSNEPIKAKILDKTKQNNSNSSGSVGSANADFETSENLLAFSPPVFQLNAVSRDELKADDDGKVENTTDNKLGNIQLKENSNGLPSPLRSGLENLSGFSMDDVRVNYNSSKPSQLQAHAFAQGTNIHVAPGKESHLPHEAWHVVQQKQGRVQATSQLNGNTLINDDTSLENEADQMGQKALTSANHNVQLKPNLSAAPAVNLVQRDLNIATLKQGFEETRKLALAFTRKEGILSTQIESLDKVQSKMRYFYGQLSEDSSQDDAKGVMKAFVTWKKNSVWDSGGSEHWEIFAAMKKEKTEGEEREAAALEREAEERQAASAAARESNQVTFSAECLTIFADMQDQYKRWDKSKKNRGAWWGSSKPGDTSGAKKVEDSVVQELKIKVAGTSWSYQDSFTGGLSFHRKTSKLDDFIYHMLPPQ